MTAPRDPTAYPEVNAILRLLLEQTRAVLGTQFVGLYLYGSLSSGDFDPASSDIDFLAVTEGELPPETVERLGAMHARLASSGLPWANRLEGSYIPRAALLRHDPSNARHPTIGLDWDFGLGQHGPEWVIQRWIVREQGVTLAGPPPATLIDPVTPEMLRAAVIDSLLGFWAEQLQGPEPEWLRTREYQAFAVLTMCRALYTLAQGALVSKPAAAAWARAALDSQWVPLIERALAWRHDRRPDDLTETLDFVRFAVERARQAQ